MSLVCIFISGHKYRKMLSLQNKLKLQKELQIFVTHNVFLDKKYKHNNNNNNTKNQT